MTDTFVDTMWASATTNAATEAAVLSPAEANALNTLTPSQLDDLPCGAVKVDDGGVVRFYNRYESELAGITPEEAIDKNFFTEVAPCTNNKLFRGCFTRAVGEAAADAVFSYTFTYKMRPTEVLVQVHRSQGSNWLLIKRK